jgi:diguanylate cyclase (GGDEF)-like protein
MSNLFTFVYICLYLLDCPAQIVSPDAGKTSFDLEGSGTAASRWDTGIYGSRGSETGTGTMLNYPTLLLVLIVFTTVTALLQIAAALPSDALLEQRLWALGNVATSLGFVVGALIDFPPLVHAGLSYALIGMGLALALRGLRIFCGQDLSWKWIVAITLASFFLPAYFVQVRPDKAERLVASGLFFGALCWVCAATLWRGIEGNTRNVMWAAVGGFSAIGLVMILRGVYLLLAPFTAFGEYTAETIQTIASVSVLAVTAAQVMVAFGLIMLVSHRYSEKLSRLTLMDGLTGALNRVALERMGERVLMRARQSQRSVSVVMVDADFFKLVNDTYGHPAGDQVLVHLAATLAAQVRPGDLVVRYGGEEFVLILDGSDRGTALRVAERLRGLIEESRVTTGAGSLSYRVSIGVSCSDQSGYSLESLVMRADAALYRAKQEGRNRVCTDGP